MLLLRSLACLLAVAVPATAQHLSHPVMASNGDARLSPRATAAAVDTVRILAAMVQFQTDADDRTTGNGHFVLSSSADSILDAPPRNGRYFADHLTFLANYYRKVSQGKTAVVWTLVDTVFDMPSVMGRYAPAKGGANTPLAELARGAWQRVDSPGRVPDFSAYDCFVLFHAGIGHDIDMISLLGYDPTPLDIPSIYIGPQAFRTLLGGGIPVNGGSFTITNTIVMPETENRTVPGLTGDYLLELGINGLLCASLGNHLGLPDLFDTQTGNSGIGRFGLMDGQGIFSFSGAFPPEPSAWEKYWLGWITPIVVPAGMSTLSLPAAAISDTVYRVPLSDAEYYLVENRNRDPLRNGQRITSTFNGVTRQQGFVRDTAGFNAFDISGLVGNIIDVEDFDWSLPGGVGDDGTFYDGGILIWHIDESVIQRTIGLDQVNANPDRRGVDLEEADGSQDIGQNYGAYTAGSGSESGTALDFWFAGNSAPVYRNEFSATTFPNTRTNLGALSHVTISGFSGRGSRMSLTITRGDIVRPQAGYPKQVGEEIDRDMLAVGDGGNLVVATSGLAEQKNTTTSSASPSLSVGGKIYVLPADSASPRPPFHATGLAALASSAGRGWAFAPSLADLSGNGVTDAVVCEKEQQGPPGNILKAFALRDGNADSLADPLFAAPMNRVLSTPAVIGDSLIAVGCVDGTVYFLAFTGNVLDSLSGMVAGAGSVVGISRWIHPNSFVVAYSDGTLRITTRGNRGGSAGTDIVRRFSGRPSGPAVTALFGPDPSAVRPLTAFVTTDGFVELVDSTLSVQQGFPVATGDSVALAPAVADIDGDGSRDIVVFGRTKIYALSRAGASLDHFPLSVPNTTGLRTPLIGDVDGDGRVDIVGTSVDGLAFAYTRDGKTAPGFPLPVGTGEQSAALLAVDGSIIFAVASGDGSISSWTTGSYAGAVTSALLPWPQYGGDARHGSLDLTSVGPGRAIASEFFPKDRAYNWPNPVYNGITHFRYYVNENASVTIRVFDIAGDKVTELNAPGMGGMDNDVTWNVGGVQSGIYFARIEAVSGGKTAVAIIKVAVVK